MTEFLDLWEAAVVVILFTVGGLVFAFAGGMMMDQTHNAIISNKSPVNITAGSQWGNNYETNVMRMENIFFIMPYIMPVIGILIAAVMIHRRTRYDRYAYGWR